MSRYTAGQKGYKTKTGQLIEDAGSEAAFDALTGAGNPSRTDDATKFFGGNSQSIRITTHNNTGAAATASATTKRDLSPAIDVSDYPSFQIAIYIDSHEDAYKLSFLGGYEYRLILYLNDTSGGAGSVFHQPREFGKGWNLITFSRENLSGSLDWSNIAWIQIAAQHINALPDDSWSFNYGGMWAGQRQRAKVCLTYDDSLDEHGSYVRSKLNSVGYSGCFAVISGLVGSNSAYLTEQQVVDMDAEGHYMVNHNSTANGMSSGYSGTITDNQWRTGVQACKDWLDSLGITKGRDIFVAPGGEFIDSRAEILAELGYKYVRGVQPLPANLSFGDNRLDTFQGRSSDTASVLQTYVETLVALGCCGCLVMHTITEGEHNAIINYLVTLEEDGLIDVVSYAELMEKRDTGDVRYPV